MKRKEEDEGREGGKNERGGRQAREETGGREERTKGRKVGKKDL